MKTIKLFSALTLLVLLSVLSSCSKNTSSEPDTLPTINKEELMLTVNNKERLIYSGSECKWRSVEPLIASVDDIGLVTANRVGSTTIYANTLKCKVTVKPKYTMYDEPLVKWGITKSELQKEVNYKLDSSDNTTLTYEGKGRVFAYIYDFDNGKLSGSSMGILTTYTDYLIDFLKERYVFIGYDIDEYTIYFRSIDNKTVGGIVVNTSYWIVVYVPSSQTKGSRNSDEDIKKLVDDRIQEILPRLI